jgi:hypothetical protein
MDVGDPAYAIFTQEEIRLLKASDDQLREQISEPSFDLKAMGARLRPAFKSGEKWAIVIHTHLYLDHILTLTLVEAFVKPKALQVDRLSFSQKVAFLDALGLLPNDLKQPVLALNKLRNQIAHKIEFEISTEDEQKLLSGLSNEIKSAMSIDEKENKFNTIMRELITFTEIERQKQAFSRLKRQQLQLKIRLELAKP